MPRRRNLHFLLVGIVAVFIGLAIWAGCRETTISRATAVQMRVDEYAGTVSDTEADVETQIRKLISSERAVFLVQVRWSITPAIHFKRFAEFEFAWSSAHPKRPVVFGVVDATPVSNNYRSLAKIKGWERLRSERGSALIHANAEVAWLLNGEVKRVEKIANIGSVQNLVLQTEELLYDE